MQKNFVSPEIFFFFKAEMQSVKSMCAAFGGVKGLLDFCRALRAIST